MQTPNYTAACSMADTQYLGDCLDSVEIQCTSFVGNATSIEHLSFIRTQCLAPTLQRLLVARQTQHDPALIAKSLTQPIADVEAALRACNDNKNAALRILRPYIDSLRAHFGVPPRDFKLQIFAWNSMQTREQLWAQKDAFFHAESGIRHPRPIMHIALMDFTMMNYALKLQNRGSVENLERAAEIASTWSGVLCGADFSVYQSKLRQAVFDLFGEPETYAQERAPCVAAIFAAMAAARH
jgi:hypothetical protein